MKYNKREFKYPMVGLDMSVYEASKKRIKECITQFDNIAVNFTGGKDSAVVLYLVEECMNEMGIEDKIKVSFNDEEFVPSDTIAFVDSLVKSEKYDFYYFCIPTLASSQILGHTINYIQWDSNREWFRQPPDYAITTDDLGNILFRDVIPERNKIMLKDAKGSWVFFNGYRVEESFNVYTSMKSNKRKVNSYLTKSGFSNRCFYCKPIYDWKIEDVFLYFLKSDLPYNKIYDYLMWTGLPLRSGIPLDKNVSKHLDKYRLYDPNYIDQLLKQFPILDASSRYNGDISVAQISKKYGQNVKGLINYINDTPTNVAKEKLLKELKFLLKLKNKRMRQNNDVLGGIPLRRLFECAVFGSPLENANIGKTHSAYVLDDFLFEGYTENDYLKWRENYERD